MPDSLSFSTQIDSFLLAVKKEGKMNLPDIAAKLGIPEETAEHWALVLERKGLLKLVYPENPFDKPFVRVLSAPPEGKK
ncbi:MAG: hypothetical protein V1820_04300 [archaeon]